MRRSNEDVVRRFFERPPDSEWPELVDPEIEIHDYDLPDAGVYRGLEGLARWAADWEEPWERWDWNVEEAIEQGNRVLAVFTITARGASGAETRRRNAMVFMLRDGKLLRAEYYADPDEARAATGIPSSSS
jgi:ketosteroid isomerase-like protein